MKKIGIVFLALTGIAVIALTAVSCNSAVKDELGTVVLDFGGSARALDSHALPILSTVRIRAEIIGSGGKDVKEYEAGQAGTVSLSLPVGDTVVIKLSAYNPSGIWSGSVRHRVEPGVNAVSVALDKKVSGLNKLLYTQEKKDNNEYGLTLYLGEEKIDGLNNSIRPYVFSRDSKGRIYVVFKSGDYYIQRYTSEGEKDGHPAQRAVGFLANDYTTGKMYGGADTLKEITENLTLSTVRSGYDTGLFAIDNGRIAGCPDWHDHALYFSKVGEPAKNKIDEDFVEEIAERYGLNSREWEVKDLFIRGDYLYILLAGENDPDFQGRYSLGAVLKWELGTGSDGLPDIVGEPILIGKTPVPPLSDYVVPSSYYKENFYGAVKVIGFDDENIYIADDGFDAEVEDDASGHPLFELTNRNRIAILNMQTNELSFIGAGEEVEWDNEWDD